MPLQISTNGLVLTVPAEPITAAAFAPFGEVLENPRPRMTPGSAEAAEFFASSSSSASSSASPSASPSASSSPPPAVLANQGSAIKYLHISRPRNLYAHAPSRVVADSVVNMFVCGARRLSRTPDGSDSPSLTSAASASSASSPASAAAYFPVRILERHPYTTQTFLPLAGPQPTQYLVIVAPSLPTPLPFPYPPASSPASSSSSSSPPLPPAGAPDLSALSAFLVSGTQAVTYAAGTWHAPMVALGAAGTAINFVVTQFANGVGAEDCQEVEFGTGVSVRVDAENHGLWRKPSKL